LLLTHPDCKDILDRGTPGDVVTQIFPDGVNAMEVRCKDGNTVRLNQRYIQLFVEERRAVTILQT